MTDYETQRANERAQRQADETRKRTETVAWVALLDRKFTNEGWAVEKRTGDDSYYDRMTRTFVRKSDALKLYVSATDYKMQWSASVSCPRDPGDTSASVSFRDLGAIPYNTNAPSASGSVGRDVGAVYSDILRRVVTPSEPLVKAALAKIAERIKQRDEHRSLAETVAGLMGKQLGDHNRESIRNRNRVHIYGDGFQVEVNGDIKIETTVDLATFKKLLPLITTKKGA